jgi:hypothetical protein
MAMVVPPAAEFHPPRDVAAESGQSIGRQQVTADCSQHGDRAAR